MTVTLFRFYFILFYFSVFSLGLVLKEKILQTLNTVFDHISKHLEVRQKYSATRRIINSFLVAWKCGQPGPSVLMYYFSATWKTYTPHPLSPDHVLQLAMFLSVTLLLCL